jgi:hypothetical protein
MTWLRQVLESARQTLWLLRRNRLCWLLAAGTLAVAALSLLMPDRAARNLGGVALFGMPAYILVLQFGLPTVVSYLGLCAVHDEISDRSVVHVFAQPVPRPALLVGKWLAVALFGAAAAALALAAYWLSLAIPDRPWRHGLAPTGAVLWAFVVAAALAAPGYAAVGVFCGAWSKRPLVTAVFFVVGWEVAVSNVPPPARVRGWTVADPVRRLLVERIAPPPQSPLDDLLQGSLGGHDPGLLPDPVTSVAWFTAIVLGLAILVYSRREYDARARD